MNEEARRMAACANFCEGISTDDLELCNSNPYMARELLLMHSALIKCVKAHEEKVLYGTSNRQPSGLIGA